MSIPSAPRQVAPLTPGFPGRVRRVGAPLAVIIVLGVVAGLIVILLTALNPVGTAIGFVLSSVVMAGVLLAYIWLDRWEPEPPRLLVFAFVWGASVAVVLSLIFSAVIEAFIYSGPADTRSVISVAVVAPFVEEAAKGLFLLLMMTGRRRYEMNSLTDCLVYAGVVAAGFTWLEDILYIAGGSSIGDSLMTAAMRLIMGPFAHSLFTTMFGLGVYYAMRQHNIAAKFGCILVGYLGAVLLHALWNGSSFLGAGAYFAVYLLMMVPIFALVITLGVFSRRREQRVVAAKLPGMAAAGLITANEATWLGSMQARKLAIAEATRAGGKPAGRAVKRFAAQVVDLAFVRDRIDRGFGDQRVLELQQDDAYRVAEARAAAPILQWLAAYRSPIPGR